MKVFENGTESANANESVTPLARLAKVDITLLKGKLSKTSLVDCTNLEAESEKGDESARFSVPLCMRLNASESVAEMSSETNFPADLLMLSVMPARLSVSPLNPVKAFDTASETV